jgi:hypothetical protein
MKNNSVNNIPLALRELIAWIDESDYSDDCEPRLTVAEWAEAQSMAETDTTIAEMVAFLRKVPTGQVLIPDNFR